MGKQYHDVSGLPSAVYRDYILTYADMWSHYVIYQSDQYQYTGYVWDEFGNSTLVQIDRESTSGFNNRWRSTVQHDVTHEYTIIEPMYAYSTEEGQGQYYLPQNTTATMAAAQIVLTCALLLVLVFRRVFLWSR